MSNITRFNLGYVKSRDTTLHLWPAPNKQLIICHRWGSPREQIRDNDLPVLEPPVIFYTMGRFPKFSHLVEGKKSLVILSRVLLSCRSHYSTHIRFNFQPLFGKRACALPLNSSSREEIKTVREWWGHVIWTAQFSWKPIGVFVQ